MIRHPDVIAEELEAEEAFLERVRAAERRVGELQREAVAAYDTIAHKQFEAANEARRIAGEYVTAREEALDAIRAANEAMAKARELRAVLNAAYAQAERAGCVRGDQLPAKPESTSVRAASDRHVRHIFEDARAAAAADF